jgi:ribose transport system ATP-binding protein
MRRPPLVEMKGVTKSFAGGTVLEGVDLSVARGEVRALVGQNGAGKSTLMKILAGLYPDYSGAVTVDGAPADLSTPRRALAHGIAVIQQDFRLVPEMSVAANIMLGQEPPRWWRWTRPSERQLIAIARRETEQWGLDLPLDRPVGQISVAGQQMVEICKALVRRARLLIMDEPTARLSAPERDRLFAIIRSLAERDVGVIYISHYLDEIFHVAETVTVLRDGSVVADAACKDLDVGRLSALMLGRELASEERLGAARPSAPTGDGAVPVLEVSGLSREPYYRDVSFSLHAGEVLGITGLVGAGRTRVLQTLCGAVTGYTGEIALSGATFVPRSPGRAVDRGVISVPEDRKRQGLVLWRSARDNMMTAALRGDLSRMGFVRRRTARRLADDYFTSLQITPRDPTAPAATFSGGNQQKIAIARALMVDPTVLLLDQPTAGVDVGTKVEIHQLIRRTASGGRGVIVVTDDLDELLAVSDRIIVMARGQVAATVDAEGIGHGELLQLITGPVA